MEFKKSFCGAAILKGACPKRVNNGHQSELRECLLYPQKRTFRDAISMSALGQKRTKTAQLLFVENWTPSIQLIVLQANQSNRKMVAP